MGRQKKGKNIICGACGKNFYVPEYRIESAKFCSLFCQNHLQYDKSKFNCLNCQKEFEDSPSRKEKRKFCSFECSAIFKTNKKACQKEKRRLAIAALREKGQYGNSGPSLRKYIFHKKEPKCELCGFKEYKSCLDIHHIDGDANNNIIENLAILCVMCHRKVHRNIIKLNNKEIIDKRRRFPKKSDKLTKEDVLEIKKLLEQKNMTHQRISELYDVRRECISKINQGKRWQNI